MTDLYGPSHRKLQDKHGTRPLADRLAELAYQDVPPKERSFIESASMFFLATVDQIGRPTVSYKGGPRGFVRVLDDGGLAFPNYDGNGMFLSLGNIQANPRIGMLFIDFERPRRLRVQGAATVRDEDPLLASYPGARSIVRVVPERLFLNCGRYIHRSNGAIPSPHLPDQHGRQPFPNWKRVDVFQGALSPGDAEQAARLGSFTADDYPGEDDGQR